MSLDIATTLPVSPSGPKGGICGTEFCPGFEGQY